MRTLETYFWTTLHDFHLVLSKQLRLRIQKHAFSLKDQKQGFRTILVDKTNKKPYETGTGARFWSPKPRSKSGKSAVLSKNDTSNRRMFHTFGRPNANGLKPELISDVQKRRFHHRLQAKPRFSWKYAQRLDGSIILHSCKFQKQQKCCTVSKFRCWIEIEFVEASRENPLNKIARLRVCETL